MDVAKHIQNLSIGYSQRHGNQFAHEISLPLQILSASENPRKLILQELTESINRINLQSICQSKFRDPNLIACVMAHIEVLVYIFSNDLPKAYRCMLTVYNNGLDYFANNEDSTWFTTALIKLSNDLRQIATLADTSLNDAENSLLRDSLQSLTRGWTTMAKDRTPINNPTSKKLAIFAVTNILFKIYFSLNTLSLCGKLINVVEGPSSGGVMSNIMLFPVSDVVTYKYYFGRLKMFEDKYEEARESLRFALKYTPKSKSCFKNRQRILVSLVPVELCLGVLPREVIATTYGLTELVQIGKAIRHGDVNTFENILEKYQKSFIRIGIYLVLEQAKTLLYRCLFKGIYRVLDNTRINLVSIEAALQWLNQDVSLNEIECLVANLIFQGKIKGYLSHQKRFLVLSKSDPFPTTAVVTPFQATTADGKGMS